MYFVSCLVFTGYFFFFFNDTATTEIYTLSLHDALPISAVQRRFPGDARVGEISRPKHLAPVLEASSSQKHSTAGASSRQPARLSVRLAPSAQLPRLRCGLHGHHYLRSGRRRSRGIQPQEAGAQVLPSIALLRGRFPGVLAWQLAPGQRRCLDRCCALSQSLSGEGPFDDRPLAHALSHGLGFLRQPCYSLPGRLGMRLCDGGAGVSQHQGTRPSLPLPSARQRLASRRVPREGPSQNEASPPLRRGAPSDSPGSRGLGPTDAVQRPQVRLSRFCDQSHAESLACVSVLQPAGDHREKHPGVRLRLPFGQNPNRYLDCECCLLPTGAFRSRHRTLVQAAVLAAAISDNNVGQHPYRLPGAPSAIGAREQAQCRQTSARLSLPARVPRGVAQARSPTVASKFPNLQMKDLCFSSKPGRKMPSVAHF